MDVFDRAQLRLLEIRGYRRHVIETSAGKVQAISAPGLGERPVAVIHGLASASHHYESVLESARAFASHVIGVDLLGHGGSDRPVVPSFGELERALVTSIDAVLDRLCETEPAIVFGNSLGGAAAIRYAHLRPERVSGLFLVAPGGAPMSEAERDALLRRFTMKSHAEALDFVDGLFDKPHPVRHLLAWGTRRRFADPALRSLLDAHAEVDVLTEGELSSLKMPIHVIWGGADKILPDSGRRFFERALPPQGTLEVVPRFGHVPQFDHSEAVMTRLRAFAARVARPAAAPHPLAHAS